MANARIFGILLTEEGMAELELALKDYWSDGPAGKYLYCKEATPDRSFFHAVCECRNPEDESMFEAEFYIPVRYIKVVMSGLERKHIGFIWPAD
jgi:hypothetical protein